MPVRRASKRPHIRSRLATLLRKRGINEKLIHDAVDSGYFLKDWADPFSGHTYITVSDMMYGNKGFSSSFEIDEFVEHIHGERVIDPLPGFYEVVVKTVEDIKAVLDDPDRRRYRDQGTLTFRGQLKEFTFNRAIPNPRRANSDGQELAVLPGIYRQKQSVYSFARQPLKVEPLKYVLHDLEPNDADVYAKSSLAYDIMRVEQHYAVGTRGLDLTFDIDTALFFATHRFETQQSGAATYEPVRHGEHSGVIYCFRFRDPPVKKAQHLIRGFDLFKTYRPVRVLRQHCGLPLIGDQERNIAICDIDCVIRLHGDFSGASSRSKKYLFPNVTKDRFYGKLLELKQRFPDELGHVVEYEWARP